MMAARAFHCSEESCGRRCGDAMVDEVVLCADALQSLAVDRLGMPPDGSQGDTDGLPTGRAMAK